MTEEVVKGGFHMAALIVVTPLLAHNAKEALLTKHPRNAFNAAVYAFVLGLEVYNVFGHWYAEGRRDV